MSSEYAPNRLWRLWGILANPGSLIAAGRVSRATRPFDNYAAATLDFVAPSRTYIYRVLYPSNFSISNGIQKCAWACANVHGPQLLERAGRPLDQVKQTFFNATRIILPYPSIRYNSMIF